jgi:hypothetical protein
MQQGDRIFHTLVFRGLLAGGEFFVPLVQLFDLRHDLLFSLALLAGESLHLFEVGLQAGDRFSQGVHLLRVRLRPHFSLEAFDLLLHHLVRLFEANHFLQYRIEVDGIGEGLQAFVELRHCVAILFLHPLVKALAVDDAKGHGNGDGDSGVENLLGDESQADAASGGRQGENFENFGYALSSPKLFALVFLGRFGVWHGGFL